MTGLTIERYKEILSRLMIVLLICLTVLPALLRSRPRDTFGLRMALPALNPSKIIIFIEGDVDHAGVYFVDGRLLTNAVTLLTMAGARNVDPNVLFSERISIVNAMTLHVANNEGKCNSILQNSMSVPQRLLLGIPLDINTMTAHGFDCLPGIGPVLAERIICYRQNNGGKMKVDDLLKVEGIGEKKYVVLKGFF